MRHKWYFLLLINNKSLLCSLSIIGPIIVIIIDGLSWHKFANIGLLGLVIESIDSGCTVFVVLSLHLLLVGLVLAFVSSTTTKSFIILG
jgi:hypothetical protein